jgi:hypothetical protein
MVYHGEMEAQERIARASVLRGEPSAAMCARRVD